MIVYVSARALLINGQRVSPKEQFRDGFPELKTSLLGVKTIGYNPKVDGRFLYEVTIPDGLTSAQQTTLKNALAAGLSAWGPTIETLANANALANTISAPSVWTNDGTKLVPPADEVRK